MGEMTTAVVIGELQPLVYSPHFGGQVRSLAEGSSSAQDHAAQEARSFESRISSSILVPGIARLATECLEQTLALSCNPFLPNKPKTSSLPYTVASHCPEHLFSGPLASSLSVFTKALLHF